MCVCVYTYTYCKYLTPKQSNKTAVLTTSKYTVCEIPKENTRGQCSSTFDVWVGSLKS